MLNISFRGLISGSFWAPKKNMIQVFSHFLKYFPLVSHTSCYTWLLGVCLGVFQGIFPLAPGLVRLSGLLFSAVTKQLYEWYFLSVCPSICPSVTPFWLCSHHRIIIKFSGVITNDQSKVHATGQGQRSKVKLTEVTTQLNHFRTVTPVWIDIWWWNDAHSLMLLRRGALLLFKVICQISRSHGSEKSLNSTQIGRFRTVTQV